MAPEATRDPNKHIKDLGKRLDQLDERAIKAVNEIYEKQKYGKIADVLIVTLQHVAYAAREVALNEIEEARKNVLTPRSYGLLNEDFRRPYKRDEFQLSEYYYDYLVDLAGIVQKETLIKANMALEEAERNGEGVNKASARLGEVLKQVALPRLQTIVRTEGTRVASAARRDIAVRASESGLGPDWLIYTSILDDRVTATCSVANNHKRPVDPNSPLWLEIPPPAHYNCRSMERYGFSWFPGDKAVPDWDEEALKLFRATRLQEFPKWMPRQLPPPKENIFRIAG